ncbi:MAG: hypothetical protein RMJ83_00435 [Armatimonadota bacterium]|nr:hypothetical protein [Armatimonadota bacterium]
MDKLTAALVPLQADNPLGLPIIRSVHEAVPVKGTNIRSGVFYVIPERQMRDYARALWEHPRLRFLHNVRYNVLSATLENPPSREPGVVLYPDRAVLIIYDYDNNLGYRVEASFPVPKHVELTPLKGQPDYFSEAEYQEAVQILAADPKYGEPLRRGVAYCSPGMPPVITEPAPPSPWGRLDLIPSTVSDHRLVSVLMHFLPGSGREGEIATFLVDMTDARVAASNSLSTRGMGDFYPAACGGPPSGGGCGSVGGSAWQALAWPASNPIWRMLVRRPSGSTGDGQTYGAGVEIADVFFNGRLVLKRGGMPVLNVFYNNNQCGPYRDWLYSETCFKCNGTDIGNGLRVANPGTQAITICDDGNDAGNFRGVGVYEEPDGELVLITECSAGWYRYITGWRFHPGGILKPRFLYGYTDSSCVCVGRLHNGYWRLHFALDGVGGLVVEESSTPRGSRREVWQPIRIEARRLRWPNRDTRWRVRKLSTGFTAEIVPGARDGFFELPTTGEGDVWVVKARASEMTGSSGAFANLTQYVNGERVLNEDIVVWYGIHLRKRGADNFECPPLGPDIYLRG